MAKYGLNQVTLIGNLGKDPELRYTDQGVPLVNLWMACTENIRDKEGNYVDRTEWVGVTLWRGQAQIAQKYARRGSTICIEGRLKTSSWETSQGERRSKTEVEGTRIILLDSPDNLPQSNNMQSPENTNISSQPQDPTASLHSSELPHKNESDETDDLPF